MSRSRLRGVILDFDSLYAEDLDVSVVHELPVDWQIHRSTTPEQTRERITHADVVLVNKVVLDENTLRQAESLRYIGVLATGMNNIDLRACETLRIIVNNVEGYGTQEVSQHALALLLSLCNRIAENQSVCSSGQWSASSQFCDLSHSPQSLNGKHCVILGQGELGQAFAALCEALGMQVTFAARPGANRHEGDYRPDFDDVLPDADVVSLHCLLSEQTHKLMNASRFAKMKSSAVLINTARGGLIDEQALISALELGQIAAAGVDVLSSEPPPIDHILLRYVHAGNQNLIITPHCAWGAQSARQTLLNQAVAKLSAFLSA